MDLKQIFLGGFVVDPAETEAIEADAARIKRLREEMMAELAAMPFEETDNDK